MPPPAHKFVLYDRHPIVQRALNINKYKPLSLRALGNEGDMEQ